MGYIEQSQSAGRTILPDLVRVVALIGIAVVNVVLFAYPMMEGYWSTGIQSNTDTTAYWLVNSLFLLKSYTLFSFMFGVGFAYQMASAERRSKAFGAQYSRRIIGLLCLGLLHIALLFQGDILVIYGMLGAVLYMFRNKSAKTLMRIGVSVYAVQIILGFLMAGAMYLGFAFAPDEMAQELANMDVLNDISHTVFGAGTFVQSCILRLKQWSEIAVYSIFMQGFGVFAFFLFGMAAVKSGIITKPADAVWGKFRKLYLPIGLIGSGFGAILYNQSESGMDPKMVFGMAILITFAPFSTAGYLGLVAKWADGPMTRFKTFMARGGTATLTAYLLQSLTLSLLFNNYGLGLYAELGAGACTALAFGVALFTIMFASLWRLIFKRGPMEYLLRRWTYLGER